MTAEQPIPPGFLDRARREAERYGDDPWILLRELVQNSRDAGATHVAFTAETRDDVDVLTCGDDGRGMTRAEMRSYLLRLYASGKAPPRGQTSEERARGPVGRFGVGFWSVLRFAPAVVRVESRADDDGTAFEIDCARGVLREVPCALAARGTRVTLVRPAARAPFVDVAERRLVHWAGAVRGIAGAAPPTLTFNGAVRNTPLVEPELIAERFRARGFDGVLGFGREPSVSLYAHGLLLREAGSLEELLPRRHTRTEAGAPGLYPVVRVNADGLEVLLNRREVVEDRLLTDIVATCERRLQRLRRRLLDRLARLRLLDRVRLAAPRAAPYAVVVALTVAAAFASYTVTRAPSADGGLVIGALPTAAIAPSRSTTSLEVSGAPRINQPTAGVDGNDAWDVRVEAPPGSFHLLELTTLSRSQPAVGLASEPPVVAGAPAWGRPSSESVRLDVGLGGGSGGVASLARLPVPSGHGLVRGSVLVDGTPADVLGGIDGEPLLRVTGSERRVRYETGPARGTPARASLLEGPATWPSAAAAVIARAARLPPADRVRVLEGFVKERVRYTTSLDDAARFDAATGPFVERALSVGAGDCDVMNALFALLLRSAGVPARVGVGLVVHGDEVAPDLHAWTEYFLEGEWRSLDVSPPLPVGDGATAHVHGAPADTAATAAASTVDVGPGAPLAQPAAIEGASPPARDAESRPPSPVPAQPFVDVRAPDSSLRVIAIGAALGGLALLAVLVALRLRTGRSRDGDDEALASLLTHWLRGSRASDPLHLRLRPFFPALGRRRRYSLAELERRAARGLLFAASPDDPLVPSLRRSALVVDQSVPAVARVLPLLPEALPLGPLAAAISRDTGDALLHAVESILRRTDDGVRVLLLPGAVGVHEVELPVRRGLTPRYLLVGERDEGWRHLAHDDAPLSTRAAHGVRFLLARTTLYRRQRAALLAALGGAPEVS